MSDTKFEPGGVTWVPKGRELEWLSIADLMKERSLYEVSKDGVRAVQTALSEDATATVSLAIKALAALCRKGIDTVELDGETIDLWDVKRDLRALLGPDD